MNRTRLHCYLATWSTIVVLAVAGCGGSNPVAVTGKIVPPANVKLVDTDSVTLDFVAEDPKGKSAATDAKDLAFTSKDIIPGKYQVVVQIQPYSGLPDSEKRARVFEALNNKFSRQHSKLAVEISKDAQQSIVIDLDKGSVSKN